MPRARQSSGQHQLAVRLHLQLSQRHGRSVRRHRRRHGRQRRCRRSISGAVYHIAAECRPQAQGLAVVRPGAVAVQLQPVGVATLGIQRHALRHALGQRILGHQLERIAKVALGFACRVLRNGLIAGQREGSAPLWRARPAAGRYCASASGSPARRTGDSAAPAGPRTRPRGPSASRSSHSATR